MRLAIFSQISSDMSWLPTLEICSPLTRASLPSVGTALIRASTPTWPDV